ncbi:hypothetical protein [Legionella impletisoli]|uniref:Coiled coil domain-containing protein n=1 Tax=Legionella impletisoli TaxID=343510 RepID=A0A917JQX9_9GAMM|nr:hypothetical protein [Legionella impletisoli]GGI79173.1 hypothetical protein GCM10007966_04590 [Legionella impletisoli]
MLFPLFLVGATVKAVYRPGKHSTLKTPQEKQAAVLEFLTSIGFEKGLDTAELYTHYNDNRKKSLTDFGDLKLGDKSLHEHLKDVDENNPDLVALQQAISEALVLDENFKKAQEEYEKQIEALNRHIADPKSPFNAYELEHAVQRLKNETKKSLNQQQQAELKSFGKIFEKEENKQRLATVLGIQDDDPKRGEKLDQAIEALKKELKDSQADNKQRVTEPLEKSHAEMLKQLEYENERVFALAGLYNKSKAVKQYIDNLHAQNRNSVAPDANAYLTITEKAVLFKGIKIEDLPVLETQTGRTIQKQGNGEFSMKLPRPIFSPAYHRGWNKKMKEDLQSLALMVKASGYDKITMDISHTDPERCAKLAMEAYEACRKTGFDSKNITIKVNGVEKKVDELFKGRADRYKAIEARAQNTVQVKERIKPFVTSEHSLHIKNELLGIKQSATGPEQQPTPSPTSPSPSTT